MTTTTNYPTQEQVSIFNFMTVEMPTDGFADPFNDDKKLRTSMEFSFDDCMFIERNIKAIKKEIAYLLHCEGYGDAPKMALSTTSCEVAVIGKYNEWALQYYFLAALQITKEKLA